MPQVLIIDPDRPTCRWLKAVLERDAFTVDTVYSGEDGLKKIAEEPPRVIVLEVALPDMDGIELIRRVRQEPATREAGIVVLSAQMQIQDIQAGLVAGADEYLSKRPGVDSELLAKIRILATRRPSQTPSPNGRPTGQARRGKIISFCSAKGGTGTTSVCVNTAYALARLETRAQVLVVDMVFPLGTVGSSLGYESPQTVARLTQTIAGNIEPDTVKTFVSPERQYGFHVLLGANDLKEANALDVNQVVPLFETLCQMYDYIFVDFGRTLSRISLPIIEMSDAVIIVLTPDINTVKMTKRVLRHMESLGIQHDRLVLINNRTIGRVWISKEEIENELGVALAASIPHEMEHVTMAINAGIPYMAKFPERSASMVFTDFARALIERIKD